MRLSHSLQSSLPTQILPALINAVCLNSLKMFIIVALWGLAWDHHKKWWSQCLVLTLGQYKSYGILTNLDWGPWFFITMNLFPSAVRGLCSGFSIFLVISQNYRLMKLRSTNTNGEFRAPADIEDGVLCHDS